MDQLRQKRIQRVRTRLRKLRADALLSMHPANIFYLSGFTGSSGALVVRPSAVYLLTDSRYTLQSHQEAKSARVQITSGSLLAAVGRLVRRIGVRRLAVEAHSLTLAQLNELRRHTGSRIRVLPTIALIEELREIKDRLEILRIRKAAQLTVAAFEEVLANVRPGVHEIELAAELEYRMKQKGANGTAFDTIVASGYRAALPHARPSFKKLRRNELVVFDLGAILHGYCSDLTRTVFLGRAPAKLRSWYHSVWQAQQAAHSATRPGATAGEIDSEARRVLEQAGLVQWFTHSTGHGLGLEVHENPKLARGQKAMLTTGNVVTIEPGIYVKGIGGIRIEDDFVVTASGAEALTSSPAKLLEL